MNPQKNKVIGFDMLSTVKILDKIAVYTGGSNYVKGIMKLLIQKKELLNISLKIMVPYGFVPDETECKQFKDENCELVYLDKLEMYDYKGIDIMFFPQVNGSLLSRFSSIKKRNPTMKIYATLHDRQHNIFKYDSYNKYYCDGFFLNKMMDRFRFYIKKIVFNIFYGENIKYIDKLFTDSNYSAQQLIHKKLKEIFIFHLTDSTAIYNTTATPYKEYILFVGGNRAEKNLVRTLEAFCEYKKKVSTKESLIVTGVNKKLIDNICKNKKIDREIINNYVRFLGYVSYEELSGLYSGCNYTIFMSKGEGYGLPVLESIRHGKAVLASRATSIPEVAGASVKYVDPYNIASICAGLVYFSNNDNLKRYTEYAEERYVYMSQIAEQDSQIMLREIVE